MVPVDALHAVIADMAMRADLGDDDAAIELNKLAETCPAEMLAAARASIPPSLGMTPVQDGPLDKAASTLGMVLGAALADANGEPVPEEHADWSRIERAAERIAAHYCRDLNDVWGVIFDLEGELAEQTGLERFGRLLEAPAGLTFLGLNVAQRLFGPAANSMPLLLPTQV